VGIIGGLISSTILTLVVVPAAWTYLDRFRVWSNRFVKKLVGATDTEALAEDLRKIERGEKFEEFKGEGHGNAHGVETKAPAPNDRKDIHAL